MKKFEAMKAVYCYLFPETRKIMHEVEKALTDELYFVTTPAKKASENLESLFEDFAVPETEDGRVNLDEIHAPVIERIVDIYSSQLHGLNSFGYSYPTSGSSEGIFHILTNLKVKGVKQINVLKGEYEGYKIQAENLEIQVTEIDPDKTEINKLEPGYWFISNPSAKNGNIIPNDFINALCEHGDKVILDFAYVGLTKPHEFDISNKNIVAAVMSFSKPYGVFRFRIGGFTFSREQMPTLFGNKWFKNVPSLFQALKLAEEIGPSGLYEKYATVQKEIIDELNKDFGIGIKASDAFLLGYLTDNDAKSRSNEQLEMIAPFKRGDSYRFCLTPYFERRDAPKSI